MNRRSFIKSGALFVPVTVGIFVPRLRCPAPVVVNSYRFGGADITTGLIASYPINEASGNALDASGNSRDMTQNGTVGAGSGGTANSRGTYSAANYFERTDAAFQLNSGDWTVAGWYYLNSTAAVQVMVGQVTTAAPAWSIYAYSTSGGGGAFTTVWNSTTAEDGAAKAGGSVATSTWNFMVGTFTVGTKAVTCQLNGGSVGTATVSGTPGTPVGTPTTIGKFGYTGFNFPVSGYVAKVKLYSRVLAADQIARLYNGGTFSTAP